MKSSLLFSASVLCVLSACGSDDSSPTNSVEDVQNLSSNADVPYSSANQVLSSGSQEGLPEVSSSSVATASPDPTSSTAQVSLEFTVEPVSSGSAYSCETSPMELGSGIKVVCDGEFVGNILDGNDATLYDKSLTYTDFVDVSKVYASLEAGEKAVFLLRHADRTSSTDQSGILTGLGELQSVSVGQKIAGAVDVAYFHSEIPRTLQTCHKIAQGRGQTEISHIALSELNGNWFVKDEAKYAEYLETAPSSYSLITNWAYSGEYADAHYDLAERAQQFVNEVVIAKMMANSSVSVAVTHDQMLVPLLIYVTASQIDLHYDDTRDWLNFLAGIAFVVGVDGNIRYIPIKGLDSGRL